MSSSDPVRDNEACMHEFDVWSTNERRKNMEIKYTNEVRDGSLDEIDHLVELDGVEHVSRKRKVTKRGSGSGISGRSGCDPTGGIGRGRGRPPVMGGRGSDNGGRKLTSKAWNHFKRILIGDGKKVAMCNHCNKNLTSQSDSRTTHLHNHLRHCGPYKAKVAANPSLDPTQTILQFDVKKDGEPTMDCWSYNQAEVRKAIIEMIIVHEYPLCMVEHKKFRHMMKVSQPLFKPFSRHTVRVDLLKMHEVEMTRVKGILQQNKGRIAITTDMWTAGTQRRGYMAITAHYVNDDWKLENRLLRFVYMSAPHTADMLCDALLRCFKNVWGIIDKLSAITLDNCSTNDARVVQFLSKLDRAALMLDGQLFHVRCSAHILHLIVKKGLDVIGKGIDRIRNSVIYWTSMPKRWEEFEEMVKLEKDEQLPKKLVLDCKTRWNFTYLMLVTALQYKDVFSRLPDVHHQYTSVPTVDDWGLASRICDKLKIFYKVTEVFSGTKYPTTNLFFSKICNIRLELVKWKMSTDATIRSMTLQMEVKFMKYWEATHGVIAIATILDPRSKLEMITHFYKKIYGDHYSVEVEKLRKICIELLEDYQKRLPSQSSSSPVAESNDVFDTEVEMDPDDEFFKLVAVSNVSQSPKSEFDIYLDDGLLPNPKNKFEFDVLAWWKVNGPRYPTLSQIARDILAIPATSVASESVFSTCGRVLEPYRSRLCPEVVEALMCCQS